MKTKVCKQKISTPRCQVLCQTAVLIIKILSVTVNADKKISIQMKKD